MFPWRIFPPRTQSCLQTRERLGAQGPPATAAAACPAGRPPRPGEEEHSQLLLISFSGFRWDCDQDVDTPNLDSLTQEGVKAKYLMLPFVTVTPPSHFTDIPENVQQVPQSSAPSIL
uniref:Uncharacterized protein n=1 Tax=Piliocolobus tephrosceles TaxID=591936 RepID=A0A8C9IEF7_9PRIM